MIILDTNILVRLATNDDPIQTAQATTLIGTAHQAFLVTDLVFGETLWVLGSASGYDRPRVAAVAKTILDDERLRFENFSRLARATELFREKSVDFTEAYAAATALELKAQGVASFDRDLKKLPVKWIKPGPL